MTLVAGVDSSAQSTKVVVCEAGTRRVVREGSAPHPDVTEVHPRAWLQTLGEATADGLLEGVSAFTVAGQQHGMVVLDEQGEVVRPALLWNDVRSAPAAPRPRGARGARRGPAGGVGAGRRRSATGLAPAGRGRGRGRRGGQPAGARGVRAGAGRSGGSARGKVEGQVEGGVAT